MNATANTSTTTSIPPRSLDKALAFVRRGGRLCVRTSLRVTVIDAGVLRRFEKAEAWLLKEDGDTYRLRHGRGNVFLLPGQLEAINEYGLAFEQA